MGPQPDQTGEPLSVVLCTVPDGETGRRLARELVERRLAACVSRLDGLSSTYRWKDGIEEDDECLLLIKSTPARFPALEAAIRAAHPYDVPEIVALPASAVSEPYLRWALESTAAEGGREG